MRALSLTYEGDLTDRTTHLVAKRGSNPASEKLRVARELGLPVVCPTWFKDSADHKKLLPLAPRYRIYPSVEDVGQENSSLNIPTSSSSSGLRNLSSKRVTAAPPPDLGEVVNFIKEPIPLLREAAERGELSVEPRPGPIDAETICLCGTEYALDAPTGYGRQQAVIAAKAGRRASTSPEPAGVITPRSIPGGGVGADHRAYTLRELLFALRCSRQSHADYFLECVTHRCEPVLLLDKKLLFSAVLPAAGMDVPNGQSCLTTATPSSSAPSSAAPSSSAPSAPRSESAPSSAAPSTAARPSPAESVNSLGLGEKEELLSLLREAADERARLTDEVQSLTDSLRQERETKQSTTAPEEYSRRSSYF